jgi:CheY-like chemotaxis protein
MPHSPLTVLCPKEIVRTAALRVNEITTPVLGKHLLMVRQFDCHTYHDGQSRSFWTAGAIPVKIKCCADKQPKAAKGLLTSAIVAMPLRVLIVDPHHDCADSLAMLLGCRGHVACVAHTGVEALTMAVGFRPHVAVLELALPQMTGLAVAQKLQHAGFIPVAFTGLADAAHRRRASEAGFAGFFVKGCDPEELFAFLESITETVRGESGLAAP